MYVSIYVQVNTKMQNDVVQPFSSDSQRTYKDKTIHTEHGSFELSALIYLKGNAAFAIRVLLVMLCFMKLNSLFGWKYCRTCRAETFDIRSRLSQQGLTKIKLRISIFI